jgi:hypothetical protein
MVVAYRQKSNRLLIVAAALAAGAAIFFHVFIRPALWPAFSTANVQEYETLFSWNQTGVVPAGAVPHRTGKVVTIRPSTWQVYRFGSQMLTQISPDWEHRKEYVIDPARLDDSWYKLPADVRASSPDEVATVIICDYRLSPVREYRGTSDFYGTQGSHKRIVWLKTYDLRSRQFIGECPLGEEHPDLSYALAGRYSGDPREIAAFIATMPLKEDAR